jgi:hypothetical protein
VLLCQDIVDEALEQLQFALQDASGYNA